MMIPTRISKRLIKHAIICLLIGAVVNVLVAWGCILWMPMTDRQSPPLGNQPGYPNFVDGPEGQMGWWHRDRGFGWVKIANSRARGSDGEFIAWSGPNVPVYRYAGWPMHAMRSRVRATHDPTTGRTLTGWHLPWSEIFQRGPKTESLPEWLFKRHDQSWADLLRVHRYTRVPLVPHPVGFVANTLFYAVLFAGLIWLIKRPRHHNTLACTTCGYNLTGNTTGACPECGASVTDSELAANNTGVHHS